MNIDRLQAAQKQTILDERDQLASQQPELARSYDEFLESYGRFRQMKERLTEERSTPLPTQTRYRASR